MKKLRIEDLSIDSFETGGSGGAGTIAAYALTWECADNPDTRPSQDIMCTGGAAVAAARRCLATRHVAHRTRRGATPATA